MNGSLSLSKGSDFQNDYVFLFLLIIRAVRQRVKVWAPFFFVFRVAFGPCPYLVYTRLTDINLECVSASE